MKSHAGLFSLLLLASPFLEAQAVVDAPITIPLYYTAIDGGAHKWGIYASLAGGATPQLFEFDTGGGGFYAVYSSTPPPASPWWGMDYTVVNTNASIVYDSGYSYSGNTVTAPVTLYSGSSGGSAVATFSGMMVGQIGSIIDTKKGNAVKWPSGSPPIDGAFYGDFGMDLTANSNGIVNLVEQMTFANGVIPGFIVNTPLNGSNGYLQIGLSSSQTNQGGFNYFTMNPLSLGTNAAGTPYYSQSSVNLNLGISNPATGSNYSTNIGIITDTGATPNIHNTQNASNPPFPSEWINGDKSLKDGLILTLSGTNTTGSNVTVYSITTASANDYANFTGNVIVQDTATTHTNFAINAGLYFFDHQQVTYDLSNGLIGMGPLDVPEPSTYALFGIGAIGLLMVMRRKKAA